MKSRPQNVSDYIDSFPKDTQKKLKELRTLVKSSAKGAKEGLKWSMPAYSYKRIAVTFAGFKDHVSLFPTPSALVKFKKDLAKYKTSRGTIQFPLDKPLPKLLIKQIVAFRTKELREEDKKWRSK
jgi:uncharacterized protein YdhG (YjbR/CyaY superfamily)